MKSLNPSVSCFDLAQHPSKHPELVEGFRINGERPFDSFHSLRVVPSEVEGRNRTIKFYTLGCKVNQYDTQHIRERFIESGFKEIYNGKIADAYVINTCTVTQKADADSLNLIRRLGRLNPRAKIIVTGCLAELDKNKIRKACPRSIIVKKGRFSKQDKAIPGLVKNPSFLKGITGFSGRTRAFLKIQDGCNNRCSYCKVPLVRGKSRSKPLSDAVSEARGLVEKGFKEIVLTGICLGSYGRDLSPRLSLVDLIEKIEKIEGLLRLRLSSIEAGDISDKLINKIAGSGKICRHLHIPIQSGDDRILKKMNRRYSAADYLNLIKKIKRRIPAIAITTDVLVGFPGESEINFKNTSELIKRILPLRVHIFPYSRREGVFAAGNFKHELKPAIIKKRILRLKNVADACAFIYKKQFLNKRMPVLIEARSARHPGYWQGYTANYIKVLVKSKRNLSNRLIPVKLNELNRESFVA